VRAASDPHCVSSATSISFIDWVDEALLCLVVFIAGPGQYIPLAGAMNPLETSTGDHFVKVYLNIDVEGGVVTPIALLAADSMEHVDVFTMGINLVGQYIPKPGVNDAAATL